MYSIQRFENERTKKLGDEKMANKVIQVCSCPVCKKWTANPYYITQQMLIHNPKWVIKEIFSLFYWRIKSGKFPE